MHILYEYKNTDILFYFQKKEEEESLPDPPMTRIMAMNAPDWPYILGGCFCALINGAIQPTFAVVFSEIIAVS